VRRRRHAHFAGTSRFSSSNQLTAVALFEAVDGGDVGMVQRRQHSGFALEPREPIVISGN
jgi:hypothetical protein